MNQRLTDAQVIEYFHLAFLQVLQARLDQDLYVLKGGTNLRYFFDSHRYSEDIDLDVVSIEPWRLEDKVDQVLKSPAMQLLLGTGSMAIGQLNKSKQSETTQRWKLHIEVRGRSASVRTRVEFSHRGADPRRILEAVPDRLVAPYALRPPTTMHYTASAAIDQKIRALASRSETQARDVFDLELLLRGDRSARDLAIERDVLDLAAERTFDLPFEAFEAQVKPFLDSEISELYNDPATWQQIQTFVAQTITRLR